MQAEYINPFLMSLARTFETMLNCKVRRGDISLKDNNLITGPISGVIGLSGKAVGTVVLNLSEEAAIKAASAMLMTELSELNDDVLDAVGELANMVAGSAKTELQKYDLSISLPNVITGEKHDVRFPSNVNPICIPYDTDIGRVMLEVGFVMAAEPAMT